MVSSLKWLYSKQPKLELMQEFVVDCAHALWVVQTTKRLVSLMLLKWFLSDSFIYLMYRLDNQIHFDINVKSESKNKKTYKRNFHKGNYKDMRKYFVVTFIYSIKVTTKI